jgi:glycosyltransferase involved in cell wall biosynthesis
MPDVSVVVATRNRAGQVARLLESLRAQTLPADRFEVVIVDDGSSDETPELLERERARPGFAVVPIRQPRSVGPAAARNDGWRAARAAIIAFTDDDCIVTPDWLRVGLAGLGPEDDAFLHGPVKPDPADWERRRGPFSHWVYVEGDERRYETCNVFYPRKVLERMDGFDVLRFSHAGEDTDLAWRAIKTGTTPIFSAEAKVYHSVVSLGARGKLRSALRWNQVVAVYRWHPELRAITFTNGVFWKKPHDLMFRLLIALLLPQRLCALRALLALPYFRNLRRRLRYERADPQYAPFYLVYDLVEMGSVARGAIRERTLML